jgi:hypothetical protein
MEMLLMGGCLALLGLAVAGLAFGAATRDERTIPAPEPRGESVAKPAPARFFAPHIPVGAGVAAQVPIEALLLQIESHVRLEQAAAESFVEYPTSSLLHMRTMSPLVQ